MMHPAPRGSLLAAGAVAVFTTGYLAVVRPRLLRWGATDDEARRPYPGAGLIPGSTRSATMAVTIDAPPSRVWPWLAQMGTNRGGWYSWDRLDKSGATAQTGFIPSGRRSPRRPAGGQAGRQRVVGGRGARPNGSWASGCPSIFAGGHSTPRASGLASTPTRSGDSSLTGGPASAPGS